MKIYCWIYFQTRCIASVRTIADDYDDASILFADLVNTYFFNIDRNGTDVDDISRFDSIVDKYAVEKIRPLETHMVAGGIISNNHLSNLLLMSMESTMPKTTS